MSKNSVDTVKLNGEEESLTDDVIEESKYTTASSATAAEYEVSDVSVLLNLELKYITCGYLNVKIISKVFLSSVNCVKFEVFN